jgi:ABC-2 type transport system ATP-binding protein
MIRIIQLNKSYGNKQVLKDINLELQPGKVYGVVGANGAGKTTLFKCIAHLESYEGKIKSGWNQLKNHLGFLQTNPVFMSKITGWEYLKLLCVARNISADEFEEQNVFELPLNQYVETYSTGMKKKLALMGVILQKNEVFILDEPFNGVDIHSNMIISEIIKKLKSKGKIVLISSHIFSTLNETCDQIIMLNNGSIIKNVEKNDFDSLELEMKSYVVGNKIEKIEI